MNQWKAERVDNINDALSATHASEQVATVQNRGQFAIMIYIAHKKSSSIIIEDCHISR